MWTSSFEFGRRSVRHPRSGSTLISSVEPSSCECHFRPDCSSTAHQAHPRISGLRSRNLEAVPEDFSLRNAEACPCFLVSLFLSGQGTPCRLQRAIFDTVFGSASTPEPEERRRHQEQPG